MIRSKYNRTLAITFIGLKVKNLIPLSNGLYKFPAGITWTIRNKKGGFELLSEPCPHCGIQARISKVPPEEVDFVESVSLWPDVKVEKI